MYRFGFNGKENDGDWGSEMMQDYGFRIYSPSICRFLSVDPISQQYPELTPYQFASNRPIQGVDMDGLEFFDSKKNPLGPISLRQLKARQDNCMYTYTSGETFYPTLRTSSGNNIRLSSTTNSTYKVRFGGNGSKLEKIAVMLFQINVNETVNHEVLQYYADANSDFDGPHADQDISRDSKGNPAAAWSTSLNSGTKSANATEDDQEKDHYTWSLDGTTDFFSAIPSNLKSGFGIKYGDFLVATYRGKIGVGTVADGSAEKIGELSGFALLSFGVNPNGGMGGIETRDVGYFIFKNTSAGEHTYPTIQDDPATQKYVKELTRAVEDSIKQKPN